MLFRITLSFLLCFTTLVASSAADQTVLSDDGREVLLKEDGTWEYLSEDRFATTRDGVRIRLGPDGRWEAANDDDLWVALPADALRLSRDIAKSGDLNFELTAVDIESVRTSKQKNSRLRSQTVMTLEVTSAVALRLPVEPEQFTVSDSRGRVYPIKQVVPGRLELKADGSGVIKIFADGSPRWWGVKLFRLEIAPSLAGQPVELTKAMSEVTKKELKALSTR